MNISTLLNNVTDRVEEAINEPTLQPVNSEDKTLQEPEPQTQEEADGTQHDQEPSELQAKEETEVTPSSSASSTDYTSIEDAIDDDINMYAGITKPVSFALPKDIKRALDNFVDDYNDARPTNKTTQAKVVAQALRKFLAIYQ